MHPDPEENRRLVRRYFDLLNGGDPHRVATRAVFSAASLSEDLISPHRNL
jgi:hypothetical protein